MRCDVGALAAMVNKAQCGRKSWRDVWKEKSRSSPARPAASDAARSICSWRKARASSPPTSRTTRARASRRSTRARAHYVRCDVSQEKPTSRPPSRPRRNISAVSTVLFNNAGTGGARDTADGVTAEGFDSVMHLHVRAALFGMKYAVPRDARAGRRLDHLHGVGRGLAGRLSVRCSIPSPRPPSCT